MVLEMIILMKLERNTLVYLAIHEIKEFIKEKCGDHLEDNQYFSYSYFYFFKIEISPAR